MFLKILDGGRISIGALAVGLAQAALDASIPYAQTREQFGRPIGTFQGVAFMVADMATEIEAARAARLEGRLAQGPGSRLRPRRRRGEAVRVRGQLTRHQCRHPGPRRLRLRRGLHGRALPARRQAHRDRRGHQPGPAPRDRSPHPRSAGRLTARGRVRQPTCTRRTMSRYSLCRPRHVWSVIDGLLSDAQAQAASGVGSTTLHQRTA